MRNTHQQKNLVLLAGSPNVGKSTIFNALTGLRQHTGNWAGKTVGVAYGVMKTSRNCLLADLPGAYSLEGISEDERRSAQCLRSDEWDCVVVVCDGCSLKRHLILALEILRLRKNTILCVNLMDEARHRGISIDKAALSRSLGIPVVFTAGDTRAGLQDLKEEIRKALNSPSIPTINITDPIANAAAIAEDCITITRQESQRWRVIMDRLLVSRRHGMAIGLLLLLAVLWLTIWGANYPGQWLEDLFSMGYKALDRIFPPSWIKGLLLDGAYATTARVLSVMLPPVAIFFLLFTFLEDLGYLPRLAFLLERSLHRCGGCGQQALTMCMGLGCNAVGVIGCRIIPSPTQRAAAILTNSMIPCNGRFPTLIFLGVFLLGTSGAPVVVAGCLLLSVAAALLSTGLLSRRLKPCGSTAPFWMELPPLRCPKVKKLLLHSLVNRTAGVTIRALTAAAPAGMILWLLSHSPCLVWLTSALDPLGRLMGMNGWILAGFVLSLPANELLLPVILMALQTTSADPLMVLSAAGLTPKMAVCMMIFTLFHWPCATTVMTIYQETKSIKNTAVAFILPTAVGFLICVMLNLVLR